MSNVPPNAFAFTTSHFHQCVRQFFDFLVRDYGFAEGEADRVGYEWLFDYKKKPVQVTVIFDGAAPYALLYWFDPHLPMEYCSLRCLTSRLVLPELPQVPVVSAEVKLDAFVEVFNESLRVQADYLIQNGQQFLRGDYSQVAENAAAERKSWNDPQSALP
jgi:hypothetical protein